MLTLPFVLLVLATLASIAAILCHLLLPTVLRLLQDVTPELRAHLLMLAAAAPWLLGLGVLISSIGDILFGACDFGNACLWNQDPTAVDPVRALAIVPLMLATAAIGIHIVWQIVRARRILAALNVASITGEEGDIRLVSSPATFAFAGRGAVYVSQGLKEKLSPEEYRALLLHERAHLARRDGKMQLFAGILAACYIPPFRRRLLDALRLANEQCCDERAAETLGRPQVAGAILAVERLMSDGSIPAALPAFTDGFVAERVRHLLSPMPRTLRPGVLQAAMILPALFGFLLCDMLYYMAMYVLYPAAL